MKFSLKYKLLVSFMTVVVLVLVGVSVGGAALIREYFISTKQHELTDKAEEMGQVVNKYYEGKITHTQLQDFVNSVDSFLDARVWVVDDNLNLITVSEEQPDKGHGNRRPASVIKPSPMPHMMDDCDIPGGYGHGMMPQQPTRQQQETTPNPKSMPNQNSRTPSQPAPQNSTGWDCDMPGSQNMMGNWRGHGMMGNRGQVDRTTMIQPEETKLVQQAAVTLDVGKPAQASAIGTVLTLADIQGMTGLIEEIKANSGKVWSKTLYHPYYEENILMVAVPLKRTDGTVTGTVMINAPIQGIESFLNKIYYYIGIAGLGAIGFAILLSSYLASGIVRPLRAMRETAAAIAHGKYTTRVQITSRDEVGELGHSLNSMAQDLGDYVNQLESMDKMRRDFVANASHELRTPLTIMRGYNQVLREKTITEPALVEKYHRIMGDEITRLEKLIAELLDLSQLQSNESSLELEPVQLGEVVENVITLLQDKSAEKGVRLVSQIGSNDSPILGDGDRLTQLVLILMDNALKFTPSEGGIIASVTEVDGKVVLTVSDTGDGIPPEDLPHIWERFYKVDKSRARGGTGLGLAIAKQIIELHGGAAEVSSTLHEGTTFSIQFPTKQV